MTVQWKNAPDAHDYPAAVEFLSLLMPPAAAHRIAGDMRNADTTERKAKDVLRAVGPDSNPLAALLPRTNTGVAKQLRRIRQGRALSPVLLVVDIARHTLLIADGDHRVAAAYWTDENALIRCRIAYWE